MKVKVFSIILLALVFSQSQLFTQQKKKQQNKSQLVGKWETVPNPMEASSLALDFEANNEFTFILSSKWHGTYKLDGSKLVSSLYIPIFKKYKEDTTTVLIYSDTLIEVGKDNGKDVTTRMIKQKDTTNKGAGIIGSWRIDGQDDKSSVITYNTSGSFEVKNILQSFKGKYLLKSDTVIVISDGRVMLRNRFIIDRGLLRLYSPTQSGPITLERTNK